MLLYANERLAPIAFATAVATGSKAIFRVKKSSGSSHIFNPSNLGITTTLLVFPWVGIAPPYQFTENVSGALDWLIPGLIVASGAFLNGAYTGRLPLVAAWLFTFAGQATVRSLMFDTPVAAALLPMSGVAFLLYTFYMVTDPATTPSDFWGQVIFGSAVAITYGVLIVSHVVFGLFFSLTIVCALRGLGLWAKNLSAARVALRLGSARRESVSSPESVPGLRASGVPDHPVSISDGS